MRIGIIGSGVSGLVSAWLLEGAHEVTLFERGERLGGHAHTVFVSLAGGRHAVDSGIHLFHPRQFPRFARLLEHLDVPTRGGPVRLTFEDSARGEQLIAPPVRSSFPQLPIGLFGRLGTHLLFARILRHGRRLVDDWDTETTLAQLAGRTGVPESFVTDLLAPVAAAMWGVDTPAEMLEFSAVVPLWYMTRLGWRAAEIVGGTRAYIDRLASTLRRTVVRVGRPVSAADRLPEGWRVVDATGQVHVFDALILATNAADARALLGRGPTADALGAFSYYPTTVAVHGDVRRMPGRRAWWSYCNIRHDGRRSRATLWKGEWDDRPLFTTWLHGDERPPSVLHALVPFAHPSMTPAHFRAQRRLDALQGRDGLWLAGVYTGGVDSHESGVESAVRVASRLDPQSARLALLGSSGGGVHGYRRV